MFTESTYDAFASANINFSPRSTACQQRRARSNKYVKAQHRHSHLEPSSTSVWVPWCLLAFSHVLSSLLAAAVAAKANYFICQPGKLLKRIQAYPKPYTLPYIS